MPSCLIDHSSLRASIEKKALAERKSESSVARPRSKKKSSLPAWLTTDMLMGGFLLPNRWLNPSAVKCNTRQSEEKYSWLTTSSKIPTMPGGSSQLKSTQKITFKIDRERLNGNNYNAAISNQNTFRKLLDNIQHRLQEKVYQELYDSFLKSTWWSRPGCGLFAKGEDAAWMS